MPDREFGMFTPTEAAYTKPGAYGVATGAEATKRGAYLGSLERYYSELEERKSEFEKGLGWQKERWGEEVGLRKSQMEMMEDWYEKQYELGMKGFETQLTTARIGARATGEGSRGAFEPYRTTSELERLGAGQVPLEWLGRQLELQRSALTRRTEPATAAKTKSELTDWDRYISTPAAGMSKGYGTEETYRSPEGTYRNY